MAEERKLRILCVEDENEIRENIAEILRDEGFEVFEAENGKKGFEVFMQEKPDLVISDIMMPEVDGYGLLKMIRESKNVKNNTTPFIFLSALGQKDNVIKGVGLSANDYLVKPIDFDLMLAKVKEKTANALKVQASHERSIGNLKSQVATVLPNELHTYLDIIVQTSAILKTSPYGDFLSNRTLDDINRIYLNAMKLKSSITNSLDASVIEAKLNSDEEIFMIIDFINEFNGGLSQKIRDRITIEPPFEADKMPKVKADKTVLVDALRRIFASLLKIEADAKVTVSTMIDHLDQMVVIFYLKTAAAVSDFANRVDEAQIAAILDKQNCMFKVVDDKEKSVVITIPKHRLTR
jgi:CheY-like chemotaxis protein